MRTTAIALLLAAAALAEEESLLKNGGFEEGRTGWILYGFESQDSFEVVKKDAAEGERALHVTKTGGASFPKVWINYDLSEKQQEGKLTFSCQAKGKKLKRVEITFLVYDTSGSIALRQAVTKKPLKGSFKWKTFETTIDIPPNAKSGRVFLAMSGKGELWLDDYQLWHGVPKRKKKGRTKKTKEKPLEVRNGDFDKSKSGWTKLRSPTESLKVALDRKVKASGSGSLRLERKGHRLYPEEGVEYLVKNMGKARSVTLRCRARGGDASRAVVVLVAESEEGALVDFARKEVGGTDFQNVELKLKNPGHARRLRITLAILGSGSAWFDDVQLVGK